MKNITEKELKRILHYCPETGVFTWLVNTGIKHLKGRVAGAGTTKYRVLSIYNTRYMAHRLAFVYMTGEYPLEVDHVNHNKHDNRWSNLRSVTTKENHRNNDLNRNNTSGITGVVWHKVRKKWTASVRFDGKRKHLGIFSKKSDAIKARAAANVELGFHQNHGLTLK